MLAAAIVQQSFSTNLRLFLFTTEEWTLRCQKPIDRYITKAKRRFKILLLRSICYRQQSVGYIWLCWRLFKKNCWNEVCIIPNALLFLIFASFTLLSQKRKTNYLKFAVFSSLLSKKLHLSIVVVYNLYWSSDKVWKKNIYENKNNTGLSKGVHSGINNIQNRDPILKEDVYHDVWHTVIIISNFQWKWMTEFSFFCMNNILLKNTSWYLKIVDVVFHKK